jgi:hypothetical protein
MLFITICLSSSSFGQTTESFDALADGSYGDSEQTHAFDFGQWASLACIINAEKDRGDSGRAVRFRHDNNVKSYLEFRGENANGITGGIGTVSFGHDTGITMAVLVFPSKSNTSKRMRIHGQLSARK